MNGGHVAKAQGRDNHLSEDAYKNLLDAFVSLRSADEASGLLSDLLTPREIEDLAQRLEVARMLDAGIPYVRIQDATGVSATTVARVARCLKYGPGGYRVVLDRLPAYSDAESK